MRHPATVELDAFLFRQRPVSPEAIARLRAMCTEDDCGSIECLAVKAALAAYDGAYAAYMDQATHTRPGY